MLSALAHDDIDDTNVDGGASCVIRVARDLPYKRIVHAAGTLANTHSA